MSPTQFHDQQQHAKRGLSNVICKPPLKINKDSHLIKKSPPSASSSSSSSLVNGVVAVANKPQQRHPVIIYTHSPKVIHTHPRDFMALVQKLTGLSPCEVGINKPKSEPGKDPSEGDPKNTKGTVIISEDNESTSVVTDENGSSIGDTQVNSCFVPPVFDPPNPCFNNFPLFAQNSSDYSRSTQPFFSYPDSLFFMPNMRSSISSSTMESLKEFPDF